MGDGEGSNATGGESRTSLWWTRGLTSGTGVEPAWLKLPVTVPTCTPEIKKIK